MALDGFKWIMNYFIFLSLIFMPKLCQSKLEQVDPNIPEIGGMDNYVADLEPEKNVYDSPVLPVKAIEKDFSPVIPAAAAVQRVAVLRAAGDPVTSSDIDYEISTTLEPTPNVFFAGSLSHDQACTVYGEDIASVQQSFDTTVEKSKRLRDAAQYFGTKICNWSKFRLECIPEKGRPPTTAAPVAGKPVSTPRLKGKCKCLHALGPNAVWYTEDKKNTRCVIPANKGHGSDCDHDIFLPYGEIDEILKVRKIVAPAGSMCIPNSNCETGYLYIGKRCKCVKGTKATSDGMCHLLDTQTGHQFTISYGLLPVLIATVFIL